MAISSFGTILKMGDGAGTEVFATVAEVSDISGPSSNMATAEVTSQSSANGYSEHIGTILHGGEVTFDIFYNPVGTTHAGSVGLIAKMNARTVTNFQLIFSDSGTTTWAFAALVKGFEPSSPVDGALTASISLLISGKPAIS